MELPFKYKLVLALVGLAFGIPTSYNGLVWMQTKFLMQQANCMSDLYETDFFDEASALAADTQFRSCLSHVDRKMGTVQFLLEEHRRSAP